MGSCCFPESKRQITSPNQIENLGHIVVSCETWDSNSTHGITFTDFTVSRNDQINDRFCFYNQFAMESESLLWTSVGDNNIVVDTTNGFVLYDVCERRLASVFSKGFDVTGMTYWSDRDTLVFGTSDGFVQIISTEHGFTGSNDEYFTTRLLNTTCNLCWMCVDKGSSMLQSVSENEEFIVIDIEKQEVLFCRDFTDGNDYWAVNSVSMSPSPNICCCACDKGFATFDFRVPLDYCSFYKSHGLSNLRSVSWGRQNDIALGTDNGIWTFDVRMESFRLGTLSVVESPWTVIHIDEKSFCGISEEGKCLLLSYDLMGKGSWSFCPFFKRTKPLKNLSFGRKDVKFFTHEHLSVRLMEDERISYLINKKLYTKVLLVYQRLSCFWSVVCIFKSI